MRVGRSPAPGESAGLIVNLSVWDAFDALDRFVHTGLHLEALRRRRSWLTRHPDGTSAIWWVPECHVRDDRGGRAAAPPAGAGADVVRLHARAPARPACRAGGPAPQPPQNSPENQHQSPAAPPLTWMDSRTLSLMLDMRVVSPRGRDRYSSADVRAVFTQASWTARTGASVRRVPGETSRADPTHPRPSHRRVSCRGSSRPTLSCLATPEGS